MKSTMKLDERDLDRMIAAMRAEAAANQWRVAVAVVDAGGSLLAFLRMDGALPVTTEMALQKARTAAVTGHPTRVWEELLPTKPGIVTMTGDYIFVIGGVPIFHQGECIGAIGVGGASPEGEALCQVGLSVLGADTSRNVSDGG